MFSSSVLDRMVIPAVFMIMLVLYRTGVNFEFIKIQMFDNFLPWRRTIDHFEDLVACEVGLWS